MSNDNWNTFSNNYNPDKSRVIETSENQNFKQLKTIIRKKQKYFVGIITENGKTYYVISINRQGLYYNYGTDSYKVDLIKTEECKAKCKFYSVCLLIKNNVVNQKLKDVINLNNVEYKNKCKME